MRYLLAAKVKPGRAGDLLRALAEGSFSRGFPFGDLGEVLLSGRADSSGTLRWVEVCYCREYYGVAMEEELPYLEEYLTEIEIADARNPRTCLGYPECGDCECTRRVHFEGEPVEDYLRKLSRSEAVPADSPRRTTRWLGWRGEVTSEEAARNEAAQDGEWAR